MKPDILSDSPEIKVIIEKLCDFILDHDGQIHPDIRLICQNNQFRVEASENAAGKYIFRVPHKILIPYRSFDLDLEDNQIIIAHQADDVSKEQREFFEIYLELINAAGKIPELQKSSIWLHYDIFGPVIDHLVSGRQGRDLTHLRAMARDSEFYDELCWLLLFKSRLVHFSPYKAYAREKSFIIPIVDFINHNNNGATYDHFYVTDEPQSSMLGIRGAMPLGGNECYARYGRFDALDTYLHYGFIDPYAKFVRSVPTTINFGDEIGSIQIEGLTAVPSKKDIPASMEDMYFYVPVIHHYKFGNKVSLSHIFIPSETAPASMRRVLDYSLSLIAPDLAPEDQEELIKKAEIQIIKRNLCFYNELEGILTRIRDRKNIKKSVEQLVYSQKKWLDLYKARS